MLLFQPLTSINEMQTKDATVSSHGVRIHAMRPPLPMLMMFVDGVSDLFVNGTGSDRYISINAIKKEIRIREAMIRKSEHGNKYSTSSVCETQWPTRCTARLSCCRRGLSLLLTHAAHQSLGDEPRQRSTPYNRTLLKWRDEALASMSAGLSCCC